MELFKRYRGLDISAYKNPIGTVKSDGTGENSFAFFPDRKVLSEVKKVNDESIRRMNAGEDPIDSDEIIIGIVESPKKSEEISDKIEDATNISSSGSDVVGTEERNRVAPTLDPDRVIADNSLERYDRIEEGQNESNRHERGKQLKRKASLADESLEQEDYIVKSKLERADKLGLQSKKAQELSDIRVRKHEEMLEDLQSKSRGPRAPKFRMAADKEPIERSGEDGAFYSEELMTIKESGDILSYKKVTYNWVLFEMDYYYRNNKEISEDTYNEVRALFE